MCGRFKLISFEDLIAGVVDVVESGAAAPRYNIAPSQDVAAVRVVASGKRHLAMLRWGLIPPWADPKKGPRLINARAETVHEKSAFRAAFRNRRCLVLADGFYEWRRDGDARTPYCFARADGAGFFMAGIWERYTQNDAPMIESCAILTTPAQGVARRIHPRMPVLVQPEHVFHWLNPDIVTRELLEPVLNSAAAGSLVVQPVSPHVNNPRHDDPRCALPVGPALEG